MTPDLLISRHDLTGPDEAAPEAGPAPHIDLIAALAAGATLVTVNNRLARLWRQHYLAEAGAAPTPWPAADILPWGSWVQRLWDRSTWLQDNAPLVLDARQSRRLWRCLIEDDVRSGAGQELRLLQSGGSARLAREAWTLAQDWRLQWPFDPAESHDDVRHFQRWAKKFDTTCTQQGWLDEGGVPARLLAALAAGGVESPARLLLLGFDAFTPIQQALLMALRARGTVVERLDPAPPPADIGLATKHSPVTRLEFHSVAEENAAAARWVRQMLEHEPNARIALIAPDLAERRAGLTRMLDAQLAPHSLLPDQAEAARPWNVSLGIPLLETGMVQAAFLAFELGEAELPLERLSQALLSPFLGGFATERDPRALLDARLRDRGGISIRSKRLCQWAAKWNCPALARLVEGLRAQRRAEPRRQSPAAWAATLRTSLRHAQWPGETAWDSGAFQLREAWLEQIETLARLEVVEAEITRAEALAELRALAGETLFQPETVTDPPLQVLGPLEAVGLQFDAVWLLGMHHRQWPETARPNPFLPMPLQARLGMPHASPQRQLEYAHRISAHLLQLAPQTLVSHARLSADGLTLEVSPLFAHLPKAAVPETAAALPLPEHWAGPVALEEWQDAAVPLPTATDGELPVPGGARVLELQSACPFRAFAERRLGAEALPEPELGPDARQRGSLLHRLMEGLWGELNDQDTLRAMDAEHCEALVRRHAEQAVTEIAERHRSLWPERLVRLEVERLSALVLQWLELERARPAFRVESLESRHTIEIGALKLAVKPDRVDLLANGRRLILDYKTGAAAAADWRGERPRAPQLPLYAVSTPHTAAIAFARVQAGEMEWVARGEGLPADRGDARDWPCVLADWRHTLEILAQAFAAGRAEVDPRDGQTCRHCPLDPLCRIHERRGGAEDPGADVEETADD